MGLFEVRAKYSKLEENEKVKTLTTPFIFDALTHTEAETRANEILPQYLNEGFKITAVNPTNYSEVHRDDNGDRFFKTKVEMVMLDEEKGIEKRCATYLLVEAMDVKDAYDNVVAIFSNSVSDFTIPSIQETKVVDFFPFVSSEKNIIR